MKVLHIIDQLNIGGAERVAVDLANLLYSSGEIQIDICILEGPSELDKYLVDGIHMKYLYRSKNGKLRTLLRLKNLIKQYDIIHVHMRHVYKFVALSNIINSNKIILHDHFGSIRIDKSVSFLLKNIFPPEFYIGVSNELLDWAQESFKAKGHYYLLQNTIVSFDEFISNKKNDRCVVIGNIKPVKNQLFILKLLKHNGFDVDFYGEIQDEVYFEELQDFIKDNSLEDRVEFISGISNVQQRISNYAFGLSASKSESGPLVLLEYLAQGIPFVSFKTGSVSDVLFDEYPSMFCDSFELNQWKNKIYEIKEFTPKFCKNLFKTKFNPNTYRLRCIEVYNEIVSY